MTRSRSFNVGLSIGAVLGAVDVLSVVGAGADDGPPTAVLALASVLGVITLVGVSVAWRGRPGGAAAVVVSRVLSALLTVPALFVDEAPDWAPPAVAIGIALTILALALIYTSRRETAPSL